MAQEAERDVMDNFYNSRDLQDFKELEQGALSWSRIFTGPLMRGDVERPPCKLPQPHRLPYKAPSGSSRRLLHLKVNFQTTIIQTLALNYRPTPSANMENQRRFPRPSIDADDDTTPSIYRAHSPIGECDNKDGNFKRTSSLLVCPGQIVFSGGGGVMSATIHPHPV